jgi:hypothetical protein
MTRIDPRIKCFVISKFMKAHDTAPVAMMDSDVANVLSRLSAYLCERLRVAVSEL